MKKLLLIYMISCLPLLAQWKELGITTNKIDIKNIDAQGDFIVATQSLGVVVSTDGGKTWQAHYNTFDIASEIGYNSVMIDEGNIYAACSVTGYISENHRNGGLYVSNDKGLNWKIIKEEYKDISFYNITKDEKGNFYAFINDDSTTISNQRIKKSTDKGLTWQEIPEHNIPDIPEQFQQRIFFQGDTLFTIARRFGIANFLYSTNNGRNWRKISIPSLQPIYNVVDMKISNQFFYIVQDFQKPKKSDNNIIYFSTNYGEDWDYKTFPTSTGGISSISIYIDEIFVATNNGIIFKTKLGSEKEEWTEIENFNLKNSKILVNENTIYVYGFGGIFASKDGAKTFQQLPVQVYDKVIDQFYEADTLYLTTFKSGVQFSSDFGNTFEPLKELNSHLDEIENTTFKIAKKNNLIALITTDEQSTIFISEDYGKNWRYSKMGFHAVSIKILNDYSILVSADRLTRISRDLANSWQSIELVGNDFNLNADLVKQSKYINEKLYIFGNNNHNGINNSGIFSSSDNAKTWEKVIYPINFDVNDIDILDDKLILITPNNILTPYEKPGTYITLYNAKGIPKVVRYKDNIFAQLPNNQGMQLSKSDYFNLNWKSINGNVLNKFTFLNTKYFLFKDNIFVFRGANGPFYRANLSDFGIDYTNTIINKEENNSFNILPPFPQPSNKSVTTKVVHKGELPINIEDINIYNLQGIKLQVRDNISITRESNEASYITWDNHLEQPGIYIMNIKQGTQISTIKIIKTD